MQKFLLLTIVFISFIKISFAQPVMVGDFTEATLNAIHNQQQLKSKVFRATTERSDTIDLLHFRIHLTVGDGTNQTIGGFAIVEFKSLMNNINQLFLDLKKLNVDSITQNNQQILFTYADSQILKIDLLNALMTGDSSAVTVYYHGHPFNDGTFGGVYFSGDFGFNVGMSLYELPHNMGRTWHPCFDNFVERANYEFYITADSNRMALCNGELIDTSHNSDGTVTWHWNQNETIPTFITGFAVSKFAPVHWTFNGVNGAVPVTLGALASDTTNMKNSFVHLQDCFHNFEQHYGPYRFNKIGFNALPFNWGAMEHAGSIVYPHFAINGSLNYEDLMAHEFGHHWWGDLATPHDATEIWLKEGWAVFSEFLFYEGEYGESKYKSAIADNHEIALHYDHVFDDGYQPLSPMPLYTTFGRTTYTKSADIVHTLRTYMGDTLFFNCLKSFVQSQAFQNYTSADLRDYLSTCSGIDLTNFFADWVFATGFPHFSIDNYTVTSNGNSTYHVIVSIRQKLDNAPHLYNGVPIEITFMDSNWQPNTQTVTVGGPCSVAEFDIPFSPSFICLDLNNKISDAITDHFETIKTIGYHNFILSKMNVNVVTLSDSAFLRIEHNFVCPDPLKTPIQHLHLSQERYWKVDGILPSDFDAKATLIYNGTNPAATSYNGAYLDRKLITNTEDSLVVMYRSGSGSNSDWTIDSDVIFNYQGSHSDDKGSITINHLKKGEYTFAIYQSNKIDSVLTPIADSCQSIVVVKNVLPFKNEFQVYPNPAQNIFTVTGFAESDCIIEIYNLLGQRIYFSTLSKGFLNKSIETKIFGEGIVVVKISDRQKQLLLQKEVIIN